MTDGFTSPRSGALVRRAHVLLAVVAAAAAPVALGSCAKSPTVILVEISADDTVPPVLQLRTTVARDADPSQPAIISFASLLRGDAADRPAPYAFPTVLPVNVPPAWAGVAEVAIEGRDWDTTAVNATGTTTVELIPGHQIQAMLTLTGAGGRGDTEGGTVGDGGDDGVGDTAADTPADGTATDDTPVDNDAAAD